MEWVLIVAAVAAIALLVRSNNQRKLTHERDRQRELDDLAAVKRALDEDITVLGEDLRRLDDDVAGRDLDDGARADYQRALDCYDAAKESLGHLTRAERAQDVAEILGAGRYAIACVRARVAGEPVPARRPPCFFNPQHGVSVRDVTWAPEGGAPRPVPACALDAERVEAGAEPDARQVMLGTRRVPYWEAGPAFGPLTVGYFGAFGVMNAVFMGTMMGAVVGGGWDGGDGGDGGGGDDLAGGDSGGGDFGGGDFGGGDFGGGF